MKIFEVDKIRAGATAAIRNAANSAEIISYLSEASSIQIEVVSGYQEAYFGFLGVINAFDVQDGFVIDIGGGSTEVTLFRGRRYQQSISFPFGAVNTNQMFSQGGNWNAEQIRKLQLYVTGRLVEHDWLTTGTGLPLYGLGEHCGQWLSWIRGTGIIRCLIPMAMSWRMRRSNGSWRFCPPLRLRSARTWTGCPKSRADIIVSGLIIFPYRLSLHWGQPGTDQRRRPA
ncbi:hypothetical protein ACFTAO_25195 [Paenibacillus rhizoplanae]